MKNPTFLLATQRRMNQPAAINAPADNELERLSRIPAIWNVAIYVPPPTDDPSLRT